MEGLGGWWYELHVCAAGTMVGGRAGEKRLLREYPRFREVPRWDLSVI